MNIIKTLPCLVPAAVILLINLTFNACTSLPIMATVTANGRAIDLVVEKKQPEDFMNIMKVILSPDKKRLLVITGEGEKILFDPAAGILKNAVIPQNLESRIEPFYKWEKWELLNYQASSPDGKYLSQFKNVTTLKDTRNLPIRNEATGETHNLGSGISSFIGPFYFSKKDRLAVHFVSGFNKLEFYDLIRFEQYRSHSVPYTSGTITGSYESMSSDSENDILVLHSFRLIQFYDFNTGELLANLLFTDSKNWVIVSKTGQYDGTPEAIDLLAWQVGEEKVQLQEFGKDFYTKGLLAGVLGIKVRMKSDINTIDIADQLTGKISQVNGREILVASGRAADTMKMGDKLFVVVNGKKVVLEVIFPMMTTAKCVVKSDESKSLKSIRPGMPVFR